MFFNLFLFVLKDILSTGNLLLIKKLLCLPRMPLKDWIQLPFKWPIFSE